MIFISLIHTRTMKITVPFLGHKNILSLHEKTIEITKDSELTTNGDCIVDVSYKNLRAHETLPYIQERRLA